MAKIEKLTFADIEGQPRTAPIWVINTSHNKSYGAHGENMGEVLIQVKDQHGKVLKPALKVWKSWLPVCVTNAYPRRMLLDSYEFRRAVNDGLITLITEKTARMLEEQEDAAEERQHLAKEEEALRTAWAAQSMTGEAYVASGDKDDDRQSINESGAEVFGGEDKETVPGISANFQAWVERMGTLTEARAMNLLRTREKFTTAELKYLIKSTTHAKVKEKASDALSRRKAKKAA